MNLELACLVLHGAACVVTIAYAIVRRRSGERQMAYLLALTWTACFVSALMQPYVVNALSPPGDAPYSGIRDRTLLALNAALYFSWPLGIAAWIRWTFIRAKPWPILLAWLLAFGIPTAIYPAIRGVAWFRLAGAVHLAAFASEISAIVAWARRREKPEPWHGIGLAAAGICTLPAISFFALPESQESYGNWVLRGAIGLHLWVLAMIGGAKWKS
jgi:hypothetical protein